MFLTRSDLAKIRPLDWELRELNGEMYYTLIADGQTQLFWYDFLRYVFAPRFARQAAFPRILNFDQSQPVYISNQLELRLPPALETVVYYAENTTPPVRFELPVSQNVVLGVAVAAIAVLCGFAFLSHASKSRGNVARSTRR